jgi:hypothetical protein
MSDSEIGPLPLGVAILAILIGIFGIFVLFLGILALLVGVGLGIAGQASVFGLTGTLAAIVLSIIGIFILAVASGLWNQEIWALALAIIVLVFYGVIEFYSASWLGLLIIVLLLAYLAAVSSHFD